MSHNRILVAAVAENFHPLSTCAVNLFRTLRAVDGPLTDAHAVVYFIEYVDVTLRRELERLGVSVRLASRFDERIAPANKMAMFNTWDEYDYLVALDTDIAIVRDFSTFARGNAIRAAVAGRTHGMNFSHWRQIYAHFNLPLPNDRYLTHFEAVEIPPYFNSGVLIIPREHVDPLARTWASYILQLLDVREEERFWYPRLFNDQIAFALTLAARNLPHCALPPEMNFHTTANLDPHLFPGPEYHPYILHYHRGHTQSGALKHSAYESVNRDIDRVNALLGVSLTEDALL